jgi:hypothetical protein
MSFIFATFWFIIIFILLPWFIDFELEGASTSPSYCDCCLCWAPICAADAGVAKKRHLPPEQVVISSSWWAIENVMFGGVLKVCRLKVPPSTAALALPNATPLRPLLSANRAPAASKEIARINMFKQVVPSMIATSSLIVAVEGASTATGSSSSSSSRGAKRPPHCLLCGDTTAMHWTDATLTVAELSISLQHCGDCDIPSMHMLSAHTGSSGSVSKLGSSSNNNSSSSRPSSSASAAVLAASSATTGGLNKGKRSHFSHISEASSLASAADANATKDKRPRIPPTAPIPKDVSKSTAAAVAAKTSAVSTSATSRGTVSSSSGNAGVSGGQRSSREREAPHTASAGSYYDAEQDSYSRGGDADVDSRISIPGGSCSGIAENQGDADDAVEMVEIVESENSLKQEVERLRWENKRLRIDTDLTMRKADRRFELEMVARRFWKGEKTVLENQVAAMQCNEQRWKAEKEKLTRLHSLLQSVLTSAGNALQPFTESGAPSSSSSSASSSTSVANNHHAIATADAGNSSSSSSSSFAGSARGDGAVDAVDLTVPSPTRAQDATRNATVGTAKSFASPATKLMKQLSEASRVHGNNPDGSSRGTSTSTGSGGERGGSSGPQHRQQLVGIKPFFCIVCFDHTARVAIQPCGHICFCTAHAAEMEIRYTQQHHPPKCPLCQGKVESFLSLQGIENLDA